MSVEIKQKISNALTVFQTTNLFDSSILLFKALGYNTERQQNLDKPTYKSFKETFVKQNNSSFNEKKALTQSWKQVHLLFQLTKAELLNQGILFDTKQVDNTIIEAYLFFAIELDNDEYTRTHLSEVTRGINKLFPMPVMILFKLGNRLTLSVINRRLHKKDSSKDVLEKITLVKDIDITNPHRGHIEILFDLSFQELYNKHQFDSFVALHNGWQKTLDANELNKKFYQELANWYFWAIENVEFPDDVKFHKEKDKDRQIRNSTNVIRLITRLIFTWFLKEKNLVPDELFDEKKIKQIINFQDKTNSTYYKTILQNLFFATLNTPMNTDQTGSRKFITNQHLIHNLYRYERFFTNKEKALELFENIPFLNGGLFECLDKKTDNDDIIRLDCFSDNPKNEKRLVVPDELFFADKKKIDLNEVYQTKSRKYEVRGIINILNAYKFTIHENTPIEEEVALDPELLGKVFENLLASYNPETETTARKQTGSFYTPREIVNYMVDESLLAYFTNYLSNQKNGNKQEIEAKLKNVLAYSQEPVVFSANENKLIVEAISQIKILDPACGSGAFPMGILHKLVYVLGKIDKDNKLWRDIQKQKAIAETEEAFNIGNKQEREDKLKEINNTFENNNGDYGRKLYLIENSIYGVDIQPIAVQIAKLRFFISLIVDQRADAKAENIGIRPLPNLETKFVAANTLIGIERPKQQTFRNPLIDIKEKELKQVREKYFTARTPRTKEKYRLFDSKLRTEIAQLLKQDGFGSKTTEMLSNWNPYDQNTSAGFFDSEWMFSFTDKFNIVIGNPPYVEARKIPQEFVDLYRNKYKTAGNRINTFSLFIENGINKLEENGLLTYIIHRNSIRSNDYSKLRKFILENCKILNILSFKIGVFENVTGEMVVLVLEKTRKNINHNVKISFYDSTIVNESILGKTLAQSIFSSLPDYRFNIYLDDKLIALLNKIKSFGKLANIANITQGIIVGDEDKFVSNIQNKPNHKPILRGRNISKYKLTFNNEYLEYYSGTQILKRGKIPELFEREEKILTQHVSSSIVATLDVSNFYYLQTINGIYSLSNEYSNKYLLAILNSSTLNFYYEYTFNMGAEFTTAVAIENLSELPIPYHSNPSNINSLVDYILFYKKECNESLITTSFYESLINSIVYELYFPEEIQKGNCEILKHLGNIKSIDIEISKERKLEIIQAEYQKLSAETHPVRKAMHFMNTIEEIAIIEAKNHK